MKYISIIILFLSFLFITESFSIVQAQNFPGKEWATRDASELGFDTSIFREMDESISQGDFGEIHSVIVVKNGYLAYENYYNQWHRDSLQTMQSATKSIISTYLGITIEQGFLDSVNTHVLPIFDKEFTIENESAYKERVTIKDLLTMRSGFQWEARWNNPDNTWRKILEYQGNWYHKIMNLPVTTEPGTSFQYQNGNPTLVTGIIQQVSGQPIHEFARDYLFKPLMIEQFRFWDGNGGPQNNGSALIYLRPVDLAKIGYLYLNKGRWKSEQIISESFVEEATSPQVMNVEENPFYSYDYGYFWWVNPSPKESSFPKPSGNIYLARGAGGQNLIVWPEQNLICVITAWNLQRTNIIQTIFDRFIVPALQSPNQN